MRRLFIFVFISVVFLLGCSTAFAKTLSDSQYFTFTHSQTTGAVVIQISNNKDHMLTKKFYLPSEEGHPKSNAAPPEIAVPHHRKSVSSPHGPIVNNIQLNRNSGSPQKLAESLVPSGQLSCFDSVINRESSWNLQAQNPSGAYGLPQALPGSKMASAGSDWRTSAHTQLKWGLDYMDSRYGSPCGAWSHEQSYGWY